MQSNESMIASKTNNPPILGPWAILTILAAICILVRLMTYHEPLERDITSYAVIAHEMLNGRDLYAEIWDHKPPAIHITYMLAEMIAGYGTASIYLMNVTAAILTLIGVFFAARELAGDSRAGVWAAGLWTIVSMNPSLQANQPNTEVFINACLIWILFLLIRHGERLIPWTTCMFIGVLTTIASFYKQVAVVPVILASFAYIAGAWVSDEVALRFKRVLQILAALLITPVVWSGVWGYFYFKNGAHSFMECVFNFNAAYVRPLDVTFFHAIEPHRMIFLLLAILPAILGLCLRNITPKTSRLLQRWHILIGFGTGTAIAVALPGYYFPHYFQLWLPILCVSFAGCWYLLNLIPAPNSSGVANLICTGILFLILLPHIGYLFYWSVDKWSTYKYGIQFVSSRNTGLAIKRMLHPGESVWNWGADSGLYFYSGFRPVTRLFYNLPLGLTGSSDPKAKKLGIELTQRVRDDLVASLPDLVVMTRQDSWILHNDSSRAGQHPILGLIIQNYEVFPEKRPNSYYVFFYRRDSVLHQRIVLAETGISSIR